MGITAHFQKVSPGRLSECCSRLFTLQVTGLTGIEKEKKAPASLSYLQHSSQPLSSSITEVERGGEVGGGRFRGFSTVRHVDVFSRRFVGLFFAWNECLPFIYSSTAGMLILRSPFSAADTTTVHNKVVHFQEMFFFFFHTLIFIRFLSGFSVIRPTKRWSISCCQTSFGRWNIQIVLCYVQMLLFKRKIL